MSLKDKLGSLVFEPEPIKKNQVAATKGWPPMPAAMPTPIAPPRPPEAMATDTPTTSYKKLLGKTDFQNTDVFRELSKYLQPLQGIPSLDETTKMKVALAQAKAQGSNVSGIGIIETLNRLKSVLKDEEKDFTQAATTAGTTDVNGKLQDIEAKKKQVDQLNIEIASLTTDVNESQRKLDRVRAEFSQALDRRTQELDREIAHYTGVLK